MMTDFMTLWRLEFKQMKWNYLVYGLIFLALLTATFFYSFFDTPVFIVSIAIYLLLLPALLCHSPGNLLTYGYLPLHRTLPISPRRVYWSFYIGTLIMSCVPFLIFAWRIPHPHRSPADWLLLGIFLLNHAIAFFWNTSIRGSNAVFGIFYLLIFVVAGIPLWVHGFMLHYVFGEDVAAILIISGILLFTLTFVSAGCRFWCRYHNFDRKATRKSLLFLIGMLILPTLLSLLIFAISAGTEQFLRQYYLKKECYYSERRPLTTESPEYFHEIHGNTTYEAVKKLREEHRKSPQLIREKHISGNMLSSRSFLFPYVHQNRSGLIFDDIPVYTSRAYFNKLQAIQWYTDYLLSAEAGRKDLPFMRTQLNYLETLPYALPDFAFFIPEPVNFGNDVQKIIRSGFSRNSLHLLFSAYHNFQDYRMFRHDALFRETTRLKNAQETADLYHRISKLTEDGRNASLQFFLYPGILKRILFLKICGTAALRTKIALLEHESPPVFPSQKFMEIRTISNGIRFEQKIIETRKGIPFSFILQTSKGESLK